MIHNTIIRRHLTVALRWLCYALLLAVCYVLQSNRVLFNLGGLRPLWLPAACLMVCGFEDAFPSAIYGMVGGLLWDFSANRLVGFYAGLLLIFCFLCNCVIQLTLRRTLFNLGVLCCVCVFAACGIDYLFTYTLFSLPQRATYFVGTLIPTVVYTVAVSTLLYPLCRAISRIGRRTD